MRFFSLLACASAFSLSLATSLTACSSDDNASPAAPSTADAGADAPATGIAALPAGQWTQIATGGDTACSDGSPYSFFVRPGTVDRVVVEFSGGGACWDLFTCANGSSLFLPNIDTNDLPWSKASTGVYDHARAENPFKDWHHVFVPYCTGDVHWGDNDKDYGGGIHIKHFGARNVRAVFDWLYANVVAPEKVMSTGCSAGGYGSILWAPYLRQHYTAAKVYQFSDSAVGAISPDFFVKVRDSWQLEKALPTFVPGLEDTASVDKLNVLYQKIGAFYPDVPLAQYNSFADDTQSAYYEKLGGTGKWTDQMTTAVHELESTVPTFRDFIAPGVEHCVLPKSSFYEKSVSGTNVASWVQSEVSDQPPPNVTCEPNCQ